MDTTTPATAPANPVTVNVILDRFARDYIPYELAPRTIKDYTRHLVVLRRWYGDRIADELKPRDFGPFLSVQKGKWQRVRQLAVLSSAFTEAVSTYFLMERNVLRDVKRPHGKPRDRLVSDEEFAGMRAMVPLRVKLAMDLALITGQRQGDILKFKWSDIKELPKPVRDPKTNEIVATHALTLQQAKTGKRLGIAITKELDAVLDRCYLLPKRGEYILTRTMGGRFTSEGFRARWQYCMRKWVRAGNARFTYHDLRALAATKQPTIEAAQLLLGHSSASLTRKIYRRSCEFAVPTSVMIVG